MIRAISAAEAAELLRDAGMHISPEVIRQGIKTGVFPFGDYVDFGEERKAWCYIYTCKLEEWINEHQE